MYMKICLDIHQYMCITNLDLGFQNMKVIWDTKGYPYLLLNNKHAILLITSIPVSPDGIGREPTCYKNGYMPDAFAPEVIKRRAIRDKQNDTGTPTPL